MTKCIIHTTTKKCNSQLNTHSTVQGLVGGVGVGGGGGGGEGGVEFKQILDVLRPVNHPKVISLIRAKVTKCIHTACKNCNS